MVQLPGGLQLFDDEFVVTVAKDWGITTKKLILTTHRLIHAKGTLVKDQEVVSLTDVSDINYHKTMLLPGEIEIETSGGHSVTGLPFAKKTKELRNQLMELVNWAKNRPQLVRAVAAFSGGYVCARAALWIGQKAARRAVVIIGCGAAAMSFRDEWGMHKANLDRLRTTLESLSTELRTVRAPLADELNRRA